MSDPGGPFQLSIVVVYRNEADSLPALFDSLHKQVGRIESCELIFIDNQSTDSSAMFVEKKAAEFYNFQHIRRSFNHMGQARQQGLLAASSSWVAFVDADTQLCPGWYEGCLDMIHRAPSHAVIIGGASTYKVSRDWHRFALPLANLFPFGRSLAELSPVQHVPTNNCLMNRLSALSAGGFHPQFQKVGEDLEINVRLRRRGTVYYSPCFSVTHDFPARRSHWFYKMSQYGRAQSQVLVLHRGGVASAKFIPAMVVLVFLSGLVLFPVWTLFALALVFSFSRVAFLFMTFLFYGFGEWIGLWQGFWALYGKSSGERGATINSLRLP